MEKSAEATPDYPYATTHLFPEPSNEAVCCLCNLESNRNATLTFDLVRTQKMSSEKRRALLLEPLLFGQGVLRRSR